jgi:hypothetical protein
VLFVFDRVLFGIYLVQIDSLGYKLTVVRPFTINDTVKVNVNEVCLEQDFIYVADNGKCRKANGGITFNHRNEYLNFC